MATIRTSRTSLIFVAVLAGLELVGVAAACFGYFFEASGTSHTGGALLVLVSSLLILGATLVTGLVASLGGALRGTLDVLLALGFTGTIAAAWLLMNWVLLWTMAAALAVWLVYLFMPAPQGKAAATH